MATVAVDGLKCTLVYNITSGGTANGTLVGPRSFHGTITAGPCPINSITIVSATGTCYWVGCFQKLICWVLHITLEFKVGIKKEIYSFLTNTSETTAWEHCLFEDLPI